MDLERTSQIGQKRTFKAKKSGSRRSRFLESSTG
jgi:hypothetical protein